MDMLNSPLFWLALAKIMWVNILLSGDNAVVIALAARNLPPKQQKNAILFGSAAAIIMRVVLTIFAVKMLQWPFLKLIGSVLLIWIGIQLMLPEEEGGHGDAADNLLQAIKTILIADLVMSLDNVIAVAAAADAAPPEAKMTLLVLGLGLSIPLIIFGSTLILKVMDRFPVIITLGAALLGFVAGEMLVGDPIIPAAWAHTLHQFEYVIAGGCAILVVVLGTYFAKRKHRSASTTPA
ncbi:TerC family protein [Parvibium lacunae]|uniref:TerC family protein n=1 Tax=Parvibium lacunae TaxID=1888893 RepID=A0A368KYK3_9BURK|nr:TerC family protein [Parvibium lacunae]RCS56503.1 TerC family protein [Parvibium lacunae]